MSYGWVGQQLADLFADISPVTKVVATGIKGSIITLQMERSEAEALLVELRKLREQGTHEWPQERNSA